MKELHHTAVSIQSDTDRNWLVAAISNGNLQGSDLLLNGLHGEVYSNISLQRFIDEELRHDHFEVETDTGNILAHSSSGEQRKALLHHIITNKPAFIILDNVFESLDIEARKKILSLLKNLSKDVLMIQLLERKRDLLPFVETVYLLEGTTIVNKLTREQFQDKVEVHSSPVFNLSIPPPLQSFPAIENPLISMNRISVRFGDRQILRDINWEINTGEFWQLKGPNGSGKSTLLAMIAGDSPKAYGQDLLLFGHKKGSGESVWSIKEKIGWFAPNMVRHFDRQDSLEKMIVSGFFDSVGLYTRPSDRQLNLAHDWLRLMGMYDSRKQPFRLSPAGHQRMVLIARAMVKHPPLLILDEPASDLDDKAAILFTALINKIANETKTAIIYVSHMNEPGLSPRYIFELVPHANGSTGQTLKA